MLVLSKIICHLVSYSTILSIVLTSNCHYIPSSPQSVLWPGPLGMRCSVNVHAPVPAGWSGVDRAALGTSVMLRAKPGTKQGWQCMFFPPQCPGTLPLLMNTLSSFCSELIFLWVLCAFQFFFLLLCFIFSRFL